MSAANVLLKAPLLQVLDTLVARAQGVPGADMCVLLVGYEEEMRKLMKHGNDGLASRFNWESRWHFQDYDEAELLEILQHKALTEYSWNLELDVCLAGVAVLARRKHLPNFGNGRAVANLLGAAALKMQARIKGVSQQQRALAVPTVQDFAVQRKYTTVDDLFRDLVACDEVRDHLGELEAVMKACDEDGLDAFRSVEFNFVFTGSPGTGKSTVARRMGSMFHSLGLLNSDEVIECSVSDFVTGFVGQAGNQTRDLFEKALGKTLFIDEVCTPNSGRDWLFLFAHTYPLLQAYRLGEKKASYMKEVLDEIVNLLTEERFKYVCCCRCAFDEMHCSKCWRFRRNHLVVIFAGYKTQVEKMLATNPGLDSRMSKRLHFNDISTGQFCELFGKKLLKDSAKKLTADAKALLPTLVDELRSLDSFSNGRDVNTLAKRAFTKSAVRRQVDAETMICRQDVQLAFDSLIQERSRRR